MRRFPLFFPLCLLLIAGLGTLEGAVVIHEIMYHPPTEDVRHEWIELHNTGMTAVELGGWRLDGGVRLTLPIDVVIAPGGFLVVSADAVAFAQRYTHAPLAIGNWEGRLSNRADTIELLDTEGRRVDRVHYADEGDWARRRHALPTSGHRGWEWVATHDGDGRSLERVNLRLPGDAGQNWQASLVEGGTPFAANSTAQTESAPLVVDVIHDPVLPGPQEVVAVRARVIDEAVGGLSVVLRARGTGESGFGSVPMFDDGGHRDGVAGDGWFGAVLEARPPGVVVEFFIEATDAAGLRRVFPAPVMMDGGVEAQMANLLYQVEAVRPAADLPLYRLIMTEVERAELATIGSVGPEASSTAQMNATFISQDGAGIQVRYQVGVRNRGFGSRAAKPNNYRVNFATDALWKGVEAINLNGQSPASQVVGSALFRQLGVPAAPSRAVRVLVNGTNLAAVVAGHPGYYAHNDVYDSDLAAKLFPDDPSGNVYRGVRVASPGADLSYRGEMAAEYELNYPKGSNVSENDYSDLIALTRALSPLTPDAGYVGAVREWMVVDSWLRYFALNTLLDNNETNPSNGDGDDYQLYSGVVDRRLYLLPRDLDTILGAPGAGGGVDSGLFRATRLAVLDRFLKHPEFVRRYYAELDGLARGGFAPERVAAMVDQVLATSTSETLTTAMKDFAARRVAFVLAAIPRGLSVTNQALDAQGRVRVLADRLELAGFANPMTTHAVEVDGRPAVWSAWEGRWRITLEGLAPGQHRLRVRALGEGGVTVDSLDVEVWREAASMTTVTGTLAAGAAWMEVGIPYRLVGEVVVPAGQTLEIGPGVTVWVEPGSALVVEGRIEARGESGRRIRLARHPATGAARTNSWVGLIFAGSNRTNLLRSVDIEDAGAGGRSVYAVGSTLVLDDVTFAGTTTTLVEVSNSSFEFRHCRFPSLDGRELIHGGDIPAGGFARIEGCVFGTTTGLNDIIDFSRARRPGPVLEVRGNLFTGASDDVLDLDGCDAHVEGNVFLHVSNGDPAAPDTSSAISFGEDGGYGPHVVAVRNVFYNVDHVALAKEGGFITLEHNTLFKCRVAAVNFSEPKRGVRPGRGARLAHNIFWDSPALFENLHPTNGVVVVTVEKNVLSGADASGWTDANMLTDPGLDAVVPGGLWASAVDSWRAAFGLRDGAAAVTAAFGGLDLGALVPGGVAVAPPPGAIPPGSAAQSAISQVREASLAVGGPGIVSYRFRVGAGEFGDWRPVEQPIHLVDLPVGTNRIEVVGRDSAGVSRDETRVVREWIVAPEAPAWPQLVEVLARNDRAVRLGERYPDLVELVNPWPVSLSLEGVWLRFEGRRRTNEFTFGVMPALAPGGRQVVVLADSHDGLPVDAGLVVAGFALDADDGRLVLGKGVTEIDAVTWGRALPDLSFVRQLAGHWTLGEPTLGQVNRPLSLGHPGGIVINEWGVAGAGDFVELYNPSPLPVDLGGMMLSDQPWTAPGMQRIPPLTFIGASSFLVFDERESEGATTRLGFGLANDAGVLGLLDRDGMAIDIVAHGSNSPGGSEGRSPSGGLARRRFAVATPGAPNPARPTTIETPPTVTPLIARTHSWHFSFPASGLSADWLESGYNDAAWNSGPALIAASDASLPWPIATHLLLPTPRPITFYFRTHIDLPAAIDPGTARLRLTYVIDDGAVFYLNGREVHRFNMPEGTIVATNRARGTVGTAVQTGPVELAADGLVAGANVVAVEVHQASSTSSDMVFGVALDLVERGTNAVIEPMAVWLNEVLAYNRSMADATGRIADFIELLNRGAAAVDVGGLGLTDDPTVPYRWQVPEGTVLQGGGMLVVQADPEWPIGPRNTGFGLSATGETVYLFDAAARGGALLDAVSLGLQAADFSVGRTASGAGADSSWRLGIPTPGEPNRSFETADAAGVRINEWMAEPVSGDDWFELFNPGPLPVALSGAYLSDDPTNPYQHEIASLSFLGPPPAGFVRLAADADAGRGPGHVNFKLRSEGESIVLTLPDGRTADAVRYATQHRGVSQGRYPDGAATWLDFRTLPSPGRSNEADRDADGLADAWEERFGLDSLLAQDAQMDLDGDGLTNLEEFLAGSDPRSGRDLPAILGVEFRVEGIAVLIEAVPDRSYELWAAAAPVGAAWERVATASGRGIRRLLPLLDPHGSEDVGARYYRVRVTRE